MFRQIFVFVLFFNLDVFGENRPIALIGTLLLPDKVIPNGTILLIDGKIAALGKEISVPIETNFLQTNGIILPGLIDLHNHVVWNVFPRWKPPGEFANRYDWQSKAIYRTLLAGPREALRNANLSCEMQIYGEIKALSQGTTSLIGSFLSSCNRGLVRNLDDDPSIFGRILYEVFPLEMSEKKIDEAKRILSSNGTFFVHLGEGKSTDASSGREFSILKSRNFLRSGVSIIHGVALKEKDFKEMSSSNVGLIWSPRSNLEIYGETTNIVAALKNGVTVALAPDWSPTGSDGLLSELNFAAAWNSNVFDEENLVRMATINAAKLAKIDENFGSLRKENFADLLVLRQSKNKSPFAAVTHALPEDVMLVFVDGQPIYGDPNFMRKFSSPNELENLEICGVEKTLKLPSTHRTFRQTQDLLNDELRRWGRRLAPLSEC